MDECCREFWMLYAFNMIWLLCTVQSRSSARSVNYIHGDVHLTFYHSNYYIGTCQQQRSLAQDDDKYILNLWCFRTSVAARIGLSSASQS